MFVRVYDKKTEKYYKSMVYGTVGIGWFLQYIVWDPQTHHFKLVDHLDKSEKPAKPLVETIQSDQSEFVFYEGAQLLKLKHYCKEKGLGYSDVKQMAGYPDVLGNYAFLVDILMNHAVPGGKYDIPVRYPNDMTAWNYILTQKDADDFMKKFAGFHDSTLESIHYAESNGAVTANAIFDNSGWFGIAELCFEGVRMLKIVPAGEIFTREIFDASLIVEDEGIFWADSYMEKPDDSYGGSIIRALNLKWRKV